MAIPQFFLDGDLIVSENAWLDEDNARHAVQVLRMQPGNKMQLTNGKGYVAMAVITTAEKKKCAVMIEDVHFHERGTALHLCVAFTKNASRNEWLLEKVTELGVSSVTPLLTTRTERERFRLERWRSILVSAMLQSQQFYLPGLTEPVSLQSALKKFAHITKKYVAHCIQDKPKQPVAKLLKPGYETLLLIGPEGDFTDEEVNLCMDDGCLGISLGKQRLRTETAAIAGCAYFNLINNE
jgi:16S rRNA (uracil1498-N3)-methyltransferase